MRCMNVSLALIHHWFCIVPCLLRKVLLTRIHFDNLFINFMSLYLSTWHFFFVLQLNVMFNFQFLRCVDAVLMVWSGLGTKPTRLGLVKDHVLTYLVHGNCPMSHQQCPDLLPVAGKCLDNMSKIPSGFVLLNVEIPFWKVVSWLVATTTIPFSSWHQSLKCMWDVQIFIYL